MSTVEKSIRLYAWKTNYQTFQVVQGEANSRKFNIQLFSTAIPVDLTNCEVMFYAVKPDSTEVYVECEVIDAENGLASVTLIDQMCVVDGTVDCWVQVIGEGGTDLRFEGMNIEVSPCLMTMSLESSDDMRAFLQQSAKLAAIETEVKNARAGKNNLREKQDAQDKALMDTAAAIRQELEAERTYGNENFDLKLGTTTWFEDVSDAGSESVKKILTYFSSLIQAVVIKFDADSNTFSVNATNGAKQVENIASYVNEGGVLAGIKFHQADDVNELFGNYGAETVCAAYGDFVESYINSLPYRNKIERVWLLNEAGVKAFSSTNEEAIIALIDRVKALGYQVSTPYANAYVITETSESILESNDFISLNLYPIGSVKMQKSNISDVIYRFNREYCIIERYLSKKDLYITEFGCSSSWESFRNPPSYVSSKEGKPISLFIEGFLRSKFIGVVKGAWLWYYHDAYTYAPETLLSVKYNTEVRYGQ